MHVMKKIATALTILLALALGLVATTPANAAKTSSGLTLNWSQTQYFPSDKTITAIIKDPNAKDAVVSFVEWSDATERYETIPGSNTVFTKNAKGVVDGYKVSAPNPHKSTYMMLSIKRPGEERAELISYGMNYNNIAPSIYLGAGVPRGVAEGEKRKIEIRVYNTHPKMIYRFQVKQGKKWKTLATKRANENIEKDEIVRFMTVKFPKKPGKYTFRVVAGPSYKKNAATAKFKATVSKQKPHKAYIKKARSYVKTYCPKTPIYTAVGPFKMNKQWAGMAYSGDMAFALQPNLGKHLRFTALHECAHILQYNIYHKAPTKVSKAYEKTGKKTFSNTKHSWTEVEASCMAMAMMRVSSDPAGGYVTSCTKKQLKQARQTIKWGLKYPW